MTTQYVTADELMDTLGVSKGKAYQIIRQLNEELAEQGYIKIAGKCPRKYFEKRYYGYTSEAILIYPCSASSSLSCLIIW